MVSVRWKFYIYCILRLDCCSLARSCVDLFIYVIFFILILSLPKVDNTSWSFNCSKLSVIMHMQVGGFGEINGACTFVNNNSRMF